MSFWNENPELYEEITINALPEEWKEKLNSGEIGLQDIPGDIIYKASTEGTEDYLAGLNDYTYEQLKGRLHAHSSAETEH